MELLDDNFNQIHHHSAPVVYASFLRRFAASFIDGLILSIPAAIINSIFFASSVFALGDAEDSYNSFSFAKLIFLPSTFVWIALPWLYDAFLNSSDRRATFGKQAMGIHVTDMNGDKISFARATGRHFAAYISAMFILIGYLIQPFTAKRQALHDIIAETLVVKD